jgi:hypothetical protein
MSIYPPLRACVVSCKSQLQRYVFFPCIYQPDRDDDRPRASEPLSTTIHDLDDDSLLHIFYIFRPSLIEDEDESGTIMWRWGSQQWWYKLVQVCSRWPRLILGSASYLGLCLVCKPGISMVDMLAHSPPFPLIIGFNHPSRELTAEEEEGILSALQHRHRVQCIYLQLPILSLQKLIAAIGDEFPALKYMFIGPRTKHDTQLTLPLTFEAPHLRHLAFNHLTSQIGSSLLSTATGLVRLALRWIHTSTYPHPNNFLQQLSLLPQLEMLEISFRSPVLNRDIERQPVTTHVTHPNLRAFDFVGVSGFLEAVLPHMTTPLLERLIVQFFDQLHFSVSHLPHFMMTVEKFRFDYALFIFHHKAVRLSASTYGDRLDYFNLTVSCGDLDRHFRGTNLQYPPAIVFRDSGSPSRLQGASTIVRVAQSSRPPRVLARTFQIV